MYGRPDGRVGVSLRFLNELSIPAEAKSAKPKQVFYDASSSCPISEAISDYMFESNAA